jgi:thiol:disulfide interchange protein DsbD
MRLNREMRLRLFGALLLCGVLGSARAQDVVRPEVAFPYTIEATSSAIELRFAVLDGYYLYRERFGFAATPTSIRLGAPQFPRGEIHEDEFFGKQEVYRHDFVITLPYERTSAVAEMSFELKLQGCADIGLCYPPQTWLSTVALPPEAEVADASRPLFGGASDEPLPVEQAFVPNPRFDRANELTVSFAIEPGYYLYRHKFEFTAEGEIELGAPELPAGVAHTDLNFGDVEVFYDSVEIVVPFARARPEALPVTIRALYQGCKEDSICYPPTETAMALTLPAASEFASAAPPSEAVMVSEQDRWLARIVGDSWWSLLGWFYAGGLVLSLTPCVLPMVPILSSIIAGQGNVTVRRGFLLSLSYVLGMAATYTAAGALAALAGGQIQALFQKPWIITLFAGLFVVLALGMFGVYQLQMPTAVQSRLANLANKQKGGTFIGTAIIGALSALIVTTCVAPPLVGALAFIGETGDVGRGAGALFALSLGMGSPLLLVGASAGQLLPKVGPWMNTVKAAFGVMMIGVAIWMLERVLPGSLTLAFWAVLVFMSGVFLGAFEALPQAPSPMRRLAKGLGVLACLYGALMLIGATLGGEDPLRPLPRGGLLATTDRDTAAPAELEFIALESVAQLDGLLAEASASGRPVMVDFTADWCVSCKEMEEYTFPDPSVIAALEPFMLLRADVTANDADDDALLKRFRSFGPPTIAFFDSHGIEQEPFKLVGYVPAAKFAAHVERVAAL